MWLIILILLLHQPTLSMSIECGGVEGCYCPDETTLECPGSELVDIHLLLAALEPKFVEYIDIRGRQIFTELLDEITSIYPVIRRVDVRDCPCTPILQQQLLVKRAYEVLETCKPVPPIPVITTSTKSSEITTTARIENGTTVAPSVTPFNLHDLGVRGIIFITGIVILVVAFLIFLMYKGYTIGLESCKISLTPGCLTKNGPLCPNVCIEMRGISATHNRLATNAEADNPEEHEGVTGDGRVMRIPKDESNDVDERLAPAILEQPEIPGNGATGENAKEVDKDARRSNNGSTNESSEVDDEDWVDDSSGSDACSDEGDDGASNKLIKNESEEDDACGTDLGKLATALKNTMGTPVRQGNAAVDSRTPYYSPRGDQGEEYGTFELGVDDTASPPNVRVEKPKRGRGRPSKNKQILPMKLAETPPKTRRKKKGVK